MRTISRAIFFCAAVVAAQAAAPASAQELALYGTVLVSGASSPTPLRFSKVLLNANGTDVGPVLTDEGGHFSFLGTNPGTYMLCIYIDGKDAPIWRKDVVVPGRLTIVVTL